MNHYHMPPIRITYENVIKRPSEAAERKSRVAGMHKAHSVGMALRLVKRLYAETAQDRG